MTARGWQLGLLAAIGAVLAVFYGGSHSNPFAISSRTEPACKFGKGFCAKFASPANSEPSPVKATDMTPLDLTAEPIALR